MLGLGYYYSKPRAEHFKCVILNVSSPNCHILIERTVVAKRIGSNKEDKVFLTDLSLKLFQSEASYGSPVYPKRPYVYVVAHFRLSDNCIICFQRGRAL